MSVQALSAAIAVTDVSATEKLVLMLLANYADDNLRCWPSHRKIAEQACVTERTVLSALKGLEAHALITRTERRRPDGSRSSDIITLVIGGEMISPRGENDSRGVGKLLQGGGETASPLTTFEPSSKPKNDPPSEPDGFEAWWGVYPRKTAKGDARKAYRAALKKASPTLLLAAVKAHDFGPDRRFFPYPATWLNDERWLDGEGVPTAAPLPPEDPWPQRLREFHRNGYWNTTDWGPKPGRPGCLAPPSLEIAA